MSDCSDRNHSLGGTEALAMNTSARRRSQRLQESQRTPIHELEAPSHGDTFPSPAQIDSLVPLIRAASRLLVRELGFMSPTLAGTQLSPSSVHALIEISSSNPSIPASPITASSLSQTLHLEKSSVSRMLKKLIEMDLVAEKQSEGDRREKSLILTEKGEQVLRGIDELASKQVGGALAMLPKHAGQAGPQVVLQGIETYAAGLKALRLGGKIIGSSTSNTSEIDREENPIGVKKKISGEVEIKQGYRSGILARCLEMHMEYYSRTVNFGAFFEAQLSTNLGTLLSRLSPTNTLDEVFYATTTSSSSNEDEKVVGTVWMDGGSTSNNPSQPSSTSTSTSATNNSSSNFYPDNSQDSSARKSAHLRSFIVDSSLQGKGVGRRLINAAMEWATNKGFQEVELWTFKGLDAARKLYEQVGFVCVDEIASKRWGTELVVQRFVRTLPRPVAVMEMDVE